MEFASPGILWWLLAVPLILLFGLWRTRPEPVSVPSLRLWAKLKERNPPVRELRRPALQLSLLLQAAAAALLVAALAGPQTRVPRPLPRTLFILLDDSASLEARDGAGTRRWDLATGAVQAIVAQAAPEDRVVVAAGHFGCPESSGGETLRYEGGPAGVPGFLGRVHPRGCGEESVVRAARLLAAECGTGAGRVLVVVSDHRNPAVEEAVRSAGGRWATVGTPVLNAGILAFSGARDARGGAELFLRCAGAPGDGVGIGISASDDGAAWRPVASVRVPLDGRGAGSRVLRLDVSPPERVLRAVLDKADALGSDDEAFIVRSGGGSPVVCFSARPGHLVKALQSVPGLAVEIHAADPARPAPAKTDARLVVYDGVVPERLPEGVWVVLADPPASVGPFEIGETGPASPDTWREAPPLTDYVPLPSIAVRRARACRVREAGEGALRTILESRERGPLLAWWDRPGGGVVYAGFDLTWRGDPAASASPWALDPGFPIFWKNVVDAALGRGWAGEGEWSSGRTCRPRGVDRSVSGPLRGAEAAVVPGGRESTPRRLLAHRPGLVFEAGTGGQAPRAAFNLFDPVETACPVDPSEPCRLPAAPEGSRTRSFAEACVAAAAVLLAAAWGLARRAG